MNCSSDSASVLCVLITHCINVTVSFAATLLRSKTVFCNTHIYRIESATELVRNFCAGILNHKTNISNSFANIGNITLHSLIVKPISQFCAGQSTLSSCIVAITIRRKQTQENQIHKWIVHPVIPTASIHEANIARCHLRHEAPPQKIA